MTTLLTATTLTGLVTAALKLGRVTRCINTGGRWYVHVEM